MTRPAAERRRNQYAGTCRVCGTLCQPDEGWLYSDTSAKAARRRGSRAWPKFVKCDRCHGLQAVRKTDLPEHRPVEVVLPTVGVGEVRKGVLRGGLWHDPRGWSDPVVDLVLPDGSSEIVAQRRPITGEPIGVSKVLADAPCFGGRRLTRAALAEVDRLGWLAIAVYERWLYHGPRCEE